MVLKFAANLNFLFTEASSIAERIHLAHRAGFRAVEIPFPRSEEEQVAAAKKETGIEVALMNVALGTGEMSLGSSSIPGSENEFKTHLKETVALAKKLQCKKIHLMAGLVKNCPVEDHLKTYQMNLKYAAGILEQENIVGLIEPINKYSVPSYFMNSYEVARNVLENVNSKNLRLMLDVFHLQLIRGNVTHAFEDFAQLIGHIQIAQVPQRHEPDDVGELNYEYVFSLIEKLKYSDWIGCEYKPKTNTIDGLKWLNKYGVEL
ncbi:putative hydroxypyruvate isomerase [Lucilia cuprina]|uniref:Putative hydroxypyruvate isomerase n=1 Tax=Lucilia cuprina TaxID=7375 RepID=A0A0L0BPT2_LUCCU|nr:putative hydroxypyruvate isomerase [Lucilia cuprina]KNC22016.1 putative hydroxypyruvate isomerase [Lucilia cuprina]